MKTSAANTASANCIAWPQPGLHLCTRGLPSHSTNRLQKSCICFFVRPLHAVSLQWLQRFHLCTCTSGWKRHRVHLHCLHPIFTGFPIEIQYTAIVFNRAQRAPVEVFSMHPAFSNGFLIEIQYTAIVFNRAQRAPASHGWFSINAVPEILILVPFFFFFFLGGGAPPINKVLGLLSWTSHWHAGRFRLTQATVAVSTPKLELFPSKKDEFGVASWSVRIPHTKQSPSQNTSTSRAVLSTGSGAVHLGDRSSVCTENLELPPSK